jgi:hypothetical protein
LIFLHFYAARKKWKPADFTRWRISIFKFLAKTLAPVRVNY